MAGMGEKGIFRHACKVYHERYLRHRLDGHLRCTSYLRRLYSCKHEAQQYRRLRKEGTTWPLEQNMEEFSEEWTQLDARIDL